MKDIIFSILGFLVLGVFAAVALWFGAALILFVFISAAFLAVVALLRVQYLRWRYKDSFAKQSQTIVEENKATIIDVEYKEVSNDD